MAALFSSGAWGARTFAAAKRQPLALTQYLERLRIRAGVQHYLQSRGSRPEEIYVSLEMARLVFDAISSNDATSVYTVKEKEKYNVRSLTATYTVNKAEMTA